MFRGAAKPPVSRRRISQRQAAADPTIAEQPAVESIDPLWVQIVAVLAGRDDPKNISIKQFYRRIAQLGGHPGWQTRYKGHRKISNYVTGIQIHQHLANDRCV